MKANNYIYFVAICVMILLSPSNFFAEEQRQAQDGVVSEKISLDLKNVDIVELLRIISLKTGKTIVPDSDISGRMTLYVNNVTFDDVLDIIAISQGLGVEKGDRFYRVMQQSKYIRIFGRSYGLERQLKVIKINYAEPKNVFNAISQLKSESGKIIVDESTGTIFLIDAPKTIELLEKAIEEVDQPLQTKIFDINYAKGENMKTQLNAVVTQGTGEVIIDERSGKAIISDLPGKMQSLSTIVRELDEESRQVYVETDIVELTLSDTFERGIDWEKLATSAAKGSLTFSGYFPAALSTAYQKISVGTLATTKYKAILNFLDTYGKTTIISQPRIAVLNNEEANVMVGTRDAYVTQTQSQATSSTVTSETVEFVDVGVKLKIVPRIGTDGFITMKLKPEVSSVLTTITTDLGSRIPIVQTSQSETVVKVKDGEMIMLAGMTKIEDSDDILGWPIISKIPFIGSLFSQRTREKSRTEVIIFITPHLNRGDKGLRGKEITEIVSMEDLPENLQNKVVRDTAIDKLLYDPDKVEKENIERKSAKEAIELATEETEKRKAQDLEKALKEKADQESAVQSEQEKSKNAAGVKAVKKAKQEIVSQDKKESSKLTAKDYYKAGLYAKSDDNDKEAIVNFIKAIELDRKYAAAYNSLGIIYEQHGQLKKAEDAYLKAVQVDEKYYPAYSNLALFNEARKDYIAAVEYWRKRVLYGVVDDEWTQQALKRIRELEK